MRRYRRLSACPLDELVHPTTLWHWLDAVDDADLRAEHARRLLKSPGANLLASSQSRGQRGEPTRCEEVHEGGASIASTPRPSWSSDLSGAVARASPGACDDVGWPVTGHDWLAARWSAPPAAASSSSDVHSGPAAAAIPLLSHGLRITAVTTYSPTAMQKLALGLRRLAHLGPKASGLLRRRLGF